MKLAIQFSQMDLVLAILKELARQQPGFVADARHYNAVVDAADAIVRELERPPKLSVPGEGLVAWRRSDEVGMSSDYMACILSGRGQREYAHPLDPSDFGRCLTMLNAAPDLRDDMVKMSECSPEWAALVGVWRELETLYESGNWNVLYERMRQLYAGIEHD